MATTQDIHAPTLGAQGEPCAGCGAPLAADQRYCLECGARRAQARIAFREILARPGGPPRAPVAPSYEERTPPSGIAFLVGLVCLLLALGVGVLIGRSGNDSPTAAATTPPPQVISVGGAAATTPAATTSTPAATTSTPASGKAKSSSSGSSSGSKSSKATNKSLKDLSNSSGQDYEKKSSKLPKQVSTGGKAPPKDNKPAGGGTDFQDIG